MKRAATIVVSMLLLLGGWGSAAMAGAQSVQDSLKYIGHAFIKLKTSHGTVMYIDPYNVNDFSDSADVILVSHEHTDHNEISRVRQRTGCRIIRAANALVAGVYQRITIGDVTITGVPAYNTYHGKSECVGFVVEFDSIRIYHAGDTGLIPEMANLASLHITYALLPMDGIYTMSPQEATTAAATINAVHDMPIHTMPPPDTYSSTIVGQFTSPHKLVVLPGQSIVLQPEVTSVDQGRNVPSSHDLLDLYPNPFNPSTVIRYHVTEPGIVTLEVYDLLGQRVGTLVRGYAMPGEYSYRFDAAGLASGVYLCSYTCKGQNAVKRMVLLR